MVAFRAVPAAALAAAFLLASCAGPAQTAAPPVEPAQIPLTLEDVPAGFELLEDCETTIESIVTTNEDPEGATADLVSRGYRGWHRAYARDATDGITALQSSVGAYANVDGAKWGLAMNVQTTTVAAGAGSEVLLARAIGDESIAFRIDAVGPDGQPFLTAFIVYFRSGANSNTVTGAGPAGTFDLETVASLARIQLARQRP